MEGDQSYDQSLKESIEELRASESRGPKFRRAVPFGVGANMEDIPFGVMASLDELGMPVVRVDRETAAKIWPKAE
jgi:hypothetical protein